jgi:hypothetical protein
MKDLNELFTDYLNFNGYNTLDDLKREINREKYYKKKLREEAKAEKDFKFFSGTKFTIEKYYLTKTDWHGLFDEFEVSDPFTAKELFENYRSNGHSMRLRSLVIKVDGEKFFKVNFKYNAPELNEL